MKKVIMALALVGFIAASGWAAEEETSMSSSENESQATAQESAADESVGEAVTESPSSAPDLETSAMEPEEPKHGFGHKLLFYIPNRILDVFDFARLRVRVGPGIAVGVRATKLLSGFIGGYASVYAGLPGPRMAPTVKLPIGFESYSGIGVSVVDATSGGKHTGPDYSPTEFGAGFQLLIVGFDFGLDPVEVLDLVTGFIFIDIRGDDL